MEEKYKSFNKKFSSIIQKSSSANIFFLLVAIAIFLVIGFSISDSFLTLYNIARVFRLICMTGLMSIGMTFVIISGNGGIDLSVGSVFAISTMIAISLQDDKIINNGGYTLPGLRLPIFLIIIICLLSGLIVGLLNGFGITKLGIPPFVMTLITLTIGRGVVLVYSNGFQLIGVRENFALLGTKMFFKYIPLTVLIFLPIAAIAVYILHSSIYGRRLLATGSNERAANISGVRTKNLIMSTYIISGVLAALAGMLFTSFTAVGDPFTGEGTEIDAISAVLIGGTPLLGGKGTMLGTILGIIFVGLMKNLLTHLGINTYIQKLIIALIILSLVLVQNMQNIKQQRSL